jgi:thioredoxin 1
MDKQKRLQPQSVNLRFITLVLILGLLGGTDTFLSGTGDNKKESAKGNTIDIQAKKPEKFKVTLVELGSTRCIPCKKMKPILDEIEKQFPDQVKVVFHDVWTDEGRPFAAKFKIRIIPTQVFLDKNGKEYFRHEGFFPKKDLIKILKMRGIKR